MFKRLVITTIIFLSVFGICEAQEFTTGKYYTDPSGLGLAGYDAVSYFDNEEPLAGLKDFSYEYDGLTYYFVNSKNQVAFKSNPEQYLPQYGGFCAYGVGMETVSGYQPGRYKSDPLIYKIIDGKLYLFYPTDEWPAIDYWNKDDAVYLKRANQLWIKIQNE